MKPFLVLFTLMVMSAYACAQENELDNQILPDVDKMPFFLAGEDEMNRFIDERIFYPWKGDSIRGQVTCRFTVTKFGDIEDIGVVESLNPLADSIAVNILRDMPRWIAATKNGVPVSAPMELSVEFDPEKIPDDRKLSETATKPSFPGEEGGLFKYVLQNLKYPESLPENTLKTRAIVQFIIDSEGKIWHPFILKSLHPDFDAHLLDIVNQMPDWEVPEGNTGCYLFLFPVHVNPQ